MNKSLVILITVFLISCSSGPQQKPTADEMVEDDFKQLRTNIPFSGIYVNEDYLQALVQTQSPRIAQEQCSECMIEIPQQTLQPTIMIYNFHEGGAHLTVLKNNNQYQLWAVNGNEPTYHHSDIQVLTESTIRISDQQFKKIKENIRSSELSKPLIIEQYLFQGNYSDQEGNTIVLDEEGNIRGFQSFTLYYPLFDYIDIGMDVDQVVFSTTQDTQSRFGFRFNADTLSLFEIICADFDDQLNECQRVDFGALKHKFWKK